MYNTTFNNSNWDNSNLTLDIDKLKAMSEEFSNMKTPYCVAMTPAFWRLAVSQCTTICNDSADKLINWSLKAEVLPNLSVPWKAYYSKEEYLLDLAKYGRVYSPTTEINE